MNWNLAFADRTRLMRRSAVRELLKLTAQPGMISFAGGLPAAELFPLERVRQATEAVLQHQGQRALQYGPTEGLPELRQWIARRFSGPDEAIGPENVVIVSGGQQALDLIGRVLLNPGDRVVVENPTYLALLSAWRPLGVTFIGVESDAHGLRVEALEAVLRQRPKLLYSVPNFQNPQGTTLSLDRRHELIRLAARDGVGLVEDNPYGDLRYEGEPRPHLLTIDLGCRTISNSQVLHVGTFSKVLMPGLRVGWIVGPEVVIDKLVQAKQAADLHTSTFNQLLTWELIRHGFLEQHVPALRQEYRARRDAMLQALDDHFGPPCHWTRPEGGMFLMLNLPEDMDAAKTLTDALQHGVAFVPGEEFHLNGLGRNTLRLNFTHVPPPRIHEGVARLAACVPNQTPRLIAYAEEV